MAGNLVWDTDGAGNIKPSRKRSSERIDGMAAGVMALSRYLVHAEVEEPVPQLLWGADRRPGCRAFSSGYDVKQAHGASPMRDRRIVVSFRDRRS